MPSISLLDLTLPTPAENLALDEALLERAEAAIEPCEVLRLWEPATPVVVVGTSSRVAVEVNLPECQRRHVPVLRRPSGGLAIVSGPGCLMYSVVLSYEFRPQLRAIDQAHAFVLERIAAALRPLVPHVCRQGISDLALGEKKFSGNSLRCKQRHLLYHGTLLYDFPLPLVGQLLHPPPRSPDYRQGRPHDDFVANLPLRSAEIRWAIASAFAANLPPVDWPAAETTRLVAEKYSREEWNGRL
ncbi:MAG: biotin/lipoate A/B protein ligase family protein [Pirellulales bacterium]